ncbi:MAG: type II secretion system protein [bacterium]
MKKYTKGFTLIELLVVIAIIGILSSVVLASLNTARNKGKDAKFQSEVAGMRAATEMVYSDNGSSYLAPTPIFTVGLAATLAEINTSANPAMLAYLTSTKAAAGYSKMYGSVSASAYAIYGILPSKTASAAPAIGTVYCIDNTGKAGINTSAYIATDLTTTPLTSCSHQ